MHRLLSEIERRLDALCSFYTRGDCSSLESTLDDMATDNRPPMKFYYMTISRVEQSGTHTWKMSYDNFVYTQTIVLILSLVEETYPVQYTVTVENQTRAKTKGPQTITTIDALLDLMETEYESYAEATLTEPQALIAEIMQSARQRKQLIGYDVIIWGSRASGEWIIQFYYDGRRPWADFIELRIQIIITDHVHTGFIVIHTAGSTYSEIVGIADLERLVHRKVAERRAEISKSTQPTPPEESSADSSERNK